MLVDPKASSFFDDHILSGSTDDLMMRTMNFEFGSSLIKEKIFILNKRRSRDGCVQFKKVQQQGNENSVK